MLESDRKTKEESVQSMVGFTLDGNDEEILIARQTNRDEQGGLRQVDGRCALYRT